MIRRGNNISKRLVVKKTRSADRSERTGENSLFGAEILEWKMSRVGGEQIVGLFKPP